MFFDKVKSKQSHFDPPIHEENMIRRRTSQSANEIGSRVATHIATESVSMCTQMEI